MKRIKWKQILSGVMAVMTVLTSAVSPMNAYAAEADTNTALYPAYEEVKEYLSVDEVVIAGDYEIEVGTAFDAETDFSGIEIPDESKVKVKFHEAKNAAGELFNSDHADTYQAVYYVDPVSGNPSYQVCRNIIVKEPVEMAASEVHTVSDGNAEQSEDSDDTGEADPDSQRSESVTGEFVLSEKVDETMPEEIAEKVMEESSKDVENEDSIIVGGEMYGHTKTIWKALVVKTADNKQDIGSYYEESYNSSVRFSVDWLELARVGVSKVDSKVTDAKLAGAVFGIYKDKECTQLITKMPATDANGYAEVEIVKTQDTVYLKEITAPKGYRRNTTAYNVKLVANETTSVTVPDVEQMAELTVYKEGEVLTGADVTDKGYIDLWLAPPDIYT